MITDFEEARRQFEQAMKDAAADNPDMEGDEYASDLVEAIALQCDAATAYELARTELGWVPSGLQRLRPDVAEFARRHPIEF